MYKDFVLYLRSKIHNDVSINSYLRDLITTLHFFMNEGWIPHFKMQVEKVDKSKYQNIYRGRIVKMSKKSVFTQVRFAEFWDLQYQP